MSEAHHKTPRQIVRILLILMLMAVFLSGCTAAKQYMGFWKQERETKSAFKEEPTAQLLRDMNVRGSYMLTGSAKFKTAYEEPILIVAVTDMFKKREIVASRILHAPLIAYQIYLPEGTYDVYFFADLNKNGYFEADEMIGGTAKAPVQIRKEEIKDDLTFNGPAFLLDVKRSAAADLTLKVAVRKQEYIVASLDDELFDPKYGEMGLYETKKFMAHSQRFMFALEEFDPKKTTVIFVHGVVGTPRDFKYLADGLDKTRYQPWFFYYPTGMPLQKLGSLLSTILKVSDESKQFDLNRTIVVAHSMGGLVSLAALNELCRNAAPAHLKGYISFNSPYGGVASAKKAIDQAPAVVDSWRDVAPGSPFLDQLYSGTAAGKIPFYMVFGYNTGDSSDGTITLQSQLEYRVQSTAAKTYGFNASHVGVLNDAKVKGIFYQMLDTLDKRK